MKRASAAFTLLEVMGAVVILGIVGVSLITSSMDSSHRARQARDRLTASLLADSALAEVESRAQAGGLTPGSQQDETPEGFAIVVETEAVDFASLAGGSLGERDRDAGPAVLLEAQRGQASSLMQIRVAVSDGSGGLVAERTSFIFDPTASADLQSLAPVEEGGQQP